MIHIAEIIRHEVIAGRDRAGEIRGVQLDLLHHSPRDGAQTFQGLVAGGAQRLAAVDADIVPELLAGGEHGAGGDADLLGEGALVER